MSVNCWKCHKSFPEMGAKISFRAECPHCGIDLHTCSNCKYYSPGKPNDCLIPGTEWIKDREVRNFCEDYALKLPATQKDSSQTTSKNQFNSLFKDEEH